MSVLAVGCSSSIEGPCDIYAEYGAPAVAAHSTTRILYSKYKGPLYQIQRESDGATLDIYAKKGYADAKAQEIFSEGTLSYITIIYDQSGHGNDLYQAAPGTFKGPAKGQFNTLPIADMAPVTIAGKKVYGVYLMPGMGFRNNNASYVAINDEAEGIYYVVDGKHYDSGCCFDYGNSSTNGKAVGTGTMETTYYGTATAWGRGNGEGPWIMMDMEAGLFSGYDPKVNDVPSIDEWKFVSVFVNGGDGNQWDLNGGDATKEELTTYYSGPRPHSNEGSDAYYPMNKKGAILLGNGGDNGNGSAGTFYEGVMTTGYPSGECIRKVQANIASVHYDVQPLSMSRLTTFGLNETKQASLVFTNTTASAVTIKNLEITLPDGWSCEASATNTAAIEPGQTATVSINITSPSVVSGGFVKAKVKCNGVENSISQRVRCASAVRINEVGLLDGGFIELYNPSSEEIDLSDYQIEITRSGWAPVMAAQFPEGTTIAANEFKTLTPNADAVALNASPLTTVFIPVSTGPWYKFDKGTTTLPLTSTVGLSAGQKISIGAGANYEENEIASVGTSATQTELSEAAKEGDTTLYLGYTSELKPGSVITISTGQRIEKATVKSVTKVQTAPRPHIVGIPDPPREPGIIELTEPLKSSHMKGVDVSCDGEGITLVSPTKFYHESGDAVQADPKQTLCQDGMHLGYAVSPRAGAIALYYKGVLIDGVTYGSKQSNSSGNGTICRPDIATLEGDQEQGGCLAEVPSSFFSQAPAIVRFPDGKDVDKLCSDFSPTWMPTPGSANAVESNN